MCLEAPALLTMPLVLPPGLLAQTAEQLCSSPCSRGLVVQPRPSLQQQPHCQWWTGLRSVLLSPDPHGYEAAAVVVAAARQQGPCGSWVVARLMPTYGYIRKLLLVKKFAQHPSGHPSEARGACRRSFVRTYQTTSTGVFRNNV